MDTSILSIIAAATLSMATLTTEAAVLDPAARIALSQSEPRHKSAADKPRYISMIIELTDGADTDDLIADGVVVWGRRDNLVLGCVPADKIDDISSGNYVARMTLSRRLDASLDLACKATRVTDVHAGADGLAGLTGRGVTVGFADSGFDPSHEVFDGRIVSVTHFIDSEAKILRAETPADIAAWTTDEPEMYHATHVGGILCGGGPSPYRGIATGADLVAATSQLYDAGILACVEDVIARAKEAREPAVINLSLGSTIGPHDGTDPFCRYLDMCADEAVIVLSAGNDGNKDMSLSHTFTENDPELASLVTQRYYGDFYHLDSFYDCWSRDNRPLSIRIRTFNSHTRQYVWASEWITAGEDLTEINTADRPDLAQYFNGSIKLAGEVNPDNRRYNVQVAFNIDALQTSPLGPWALHHLEIDITAAPGVTADIYAETTRCLLGSYNLPGQRRGNADGSISNLACGHNTITVGSTNTRHNVTYLDGHSETWTYIGDGPMSITSSYGVLADGRSLPHICAPGAAIIAAASGLYFDAHPDEVADLAYRTPGGDAYLPLSGTSMAAPHAAGIFALWLEADPTLTPGEIRDIAMTTATPIADGAVREGAGCIDALAGLRYIIKRGGVSSPELDPVVIRRSGNRLDVETLNGSQPDVDVYDVTGRHVSSENLPATPVIVRVTTRAGVIIRKL
ncbi:MAG: S8 family serine peptidase [Bacteroidales bacterium]|nr:S8 family serine peptidase [Bacteroidales bacterium]